VNIRQISLHRSNITRQHHPIQSTTSRIWFAVGTASGLQKRGLCSRMLSVSLTARRLPPISPPVSPAGNSALVEREAVALPLDYAFGFELVDVRAAAIEVLR
jgi:hypothetical protein